MMSASVHSTSARICQYFVFLWLSNYAVHLSDLTLF